MNAFSILLAAALSGALAACSPESPPSSPQATRSALQAPSSGGPLFVDATADSGIRFEHLNGMSGEFLYPEIIGSGVALLDYDNDGKPDVLVLQGGTLAAAPRTAAGPGACGARLFHNELVVSADGRRSLRFADVTEASGLCTRGYGMGVAVGDVDNDGCVDVFVTHFAAANQLFRNNCDGTFTDVSARAGVAGQGRWATSATFVDFDRDGLLDLYVTHYVAYEVAGNKRCFNSTGARDYCAPSSYPPVPGSLYRNRGDGRFEDVSHAAGIDAAFGNGLGVIAADFDGDGWPDIFVANDGNPAQLWINQRNGRFKDEAGIRGCAVNADGAPEAGMGVDLADFDGNGTEDLIVTHLTREKATLYVNLGGGQFEDRSALAGLAAATSPYTGFGTAFLDYDNDGWLDLVIANGAVHTIEELVRKSDPFPVHQRKQLFRNLGNGRYEEVTAVAGPAFALSEVGRGLAVGDLDNDGAMDVVVSNNNGPLRVFLNRASTSHDWLGLRLLSGRRDAYGAVVELRRKGAPALRRRVRADGSYLSAQDARLLIGLGAEASLESLVVHWPHGKRETFPLPPLRRYSTLVEGTGL